MNSKKQLLGIALLILLFFVLIQIKKDNMSSDNLLLPDNLEIEYRPLNEEQMNLISKIKSSQDLINYINQNISIESSVGLLSKQPSELLSTKSGEIQDVAYLSNYILLRNGLFSSLILYSYKENNKEEYNIIVPFRDIDVPKYIYFNKNEAVAINHGWSFEEMFQKEEERLGLKIIRYNILNPKTGFLETSEWLSRDERIEQARFIEE